MILIRVKRDGAGCPQKIEFFGHADFDDCGRDIVCAAVSGITLGMANAVHSMFGVHIGKPATAEKSTDPRLVLALPHTGCNETRDKICLLLEAIVQALKAVSNEYPGNVSVEDTGLNT